MNKWRLMDISIYYHLKDLYSAYNITPREGFLLDLFSGDLPDVRFDTANIYFKPLELGNRHDRIYRTYTFQVVGTSKKQRDDLVYILLEGSESPVTVYNYNDGFPPDVSPPVIGKLIPTNIIFDAFTYGDKSDNTKVLYTGSISITYEYVAKT